MPREMRLAARPHGGVPTYVNVTPVSSCSPIADNVVQQPEGVTLQKYPQTRLLLILAEEAV